MATFYEENTSPGELDYIASHAKSFRVWAHRHHKLRQASLYSGGTNNGSKHISEGSLNDVRPLADEGQYITG